MSDHVLPMPPKPEVEPDLKSYEEPLWLSWLYVAFFLFMAIIAYSQISTSSPPVWWPLKGFYYAGVVVFIGLTGASLVMSAISLWNACHSERQRQKAKRLALADAERQADILWHERIAQVKRQNLENEYAHLPDGDRLIKVAAAMRAWEELGRPGW